MQQFAYIVQGVDQALNIATMPKLCAPNILLEKSAVGVIVGWITIHPLIEPKGDVNPITDPKQYCILEHFKR